MADEAVLGIDIGTSSCKALLLSTGGALVGSEAASYDLAQPRPGWTEQDPALWIEGARRAVGRLIATHPDVAIRAIGLSGQMHGLTPLDEADRVLRPALLWNDQRNGAECVALTQAAGGEAALRGFTNNRMLLGYTGGKVAWMKNHEPQLFSRLKHVLNPKDYLRLVLTGEKATEVSVASGTGLFDVRARAWSFALMDRLAIDADLFPACHESPETTGRVSRSGAALFGLAEGTPVVGGGGDSVIQTIGSGVIAPGDVQTTIGTAGIVASALDRVIDNPQSRLQVFCNVAPGKWHAMGVTLNAGFAMNWFQRLLRGFTEGKDWSYQGIAACAGGSPAGSRGLVFLPYLNGERAPHSDPDARGAFIGLTGLHGPSDMARAVMEGIAFALYDIFTVMREAGIEAHLVKASGGGARSVLWRQMQADLFGCDVVTTEGAAEGAAFGAALVAGLGIGLFKTPEQAAGLCRPLTRETANGASRAHLQPGFAAYQALYPALRDTLHGLSQAFDDIGR
jgi:xylulokinase